MLSTFEMNKIKRDFHSWRVFVTFECFLYASELGEEEKDTTK